MLDLILRDTKLADLALWTEGLCMGLGAMRLFDIWWYELRGRKKGR